MMNKAKIYTLKKQLPVIYLAIVMAVLVDIDLLATVFIYAPLALLAYSIHSGRSELGIMGVAIFLCTSSAVHPLFALTDVYKTLLLTIVLIMPSIMLLDRFLLLRVNASIKPLPVLHRVKASLQPMLGVVVIVIIIIGALVALSMVPVLNIYIFGSGSFAELQILLIISITIMVCAPFLMH